VDLQDRGKYRMLPTLGIPNRIQRIDGIQQRGLEVFTEYVYRHMV